MKRKVKNEKKKKTDTRYSLVVKTTTKMKQILFGSINYVDIVCIPALIKNQYVI